MPIVAIFDSGVGGLSIYQQVKARLPYCDYVLVSDNLAYPYGDKTEDELNQRVVQVMQRILKQFQPDLVVVACNTASTVVLPLLRANCEVPVVGVVPAIKPAARVSKTRHIGLLATAATVRRKYTDQLIADFAPDCRITKVGSARLVNIAEDKLYGKSVDVAAIEAELSPFLEAPECDTLVLACTHFPLLNKEIEAVFKARNHPVTLIDSGLGIANRVASLIEPGASPTHHQGRSLAVFTRELDNDPAIVTQLLKLGVQYHGLLRPL